MSRGRKRVEVDRSIVLSILSSVDNESFDGGYVKLCELVSDKYKSKTGKVVTAATIFNRLTKEWNYKFKCPKGKRGRISSNSSMGTKKSRAEKYKNSPEAKEHISEMKRDFPEEFHSLIEKYEKTYSTNTAIKLNCISCVGYDKSEIRKCKLKHCPLWLLRPYK